MCGAALPSQNNRRITPHAHSHWCKEGACTPLLSVSLRDSAFRLRSSHDSPLPARQEFERANEMSDQAREREREGGEKNGGVTKQSRFLDTATPEARGRPPRPRCLTLSLSLSSRACACIMYVRESAMRAARGALCTPNTARGVTAAWAWLARPRTRRSGEAGGVNAASQATGCQARIF